MEENFIKDDSLVAVKEVNGGFEYTFQCEYASEALNYVPIGYIDKTVCGCGLTTVAIKEQCHTLIAVPNISLVLNKASQYPDDLLGVYGEVRPEDVESYINRRLKENQFVKIIVTYDSIWKCESFLNRCHHIVIDESDRMATYCDQKTKDTLAGEEDAIYRMLRLVYEHKEKVSFISATPIPTEIFEPHRWINGLPQIKMNWALEKAKTMIAIECANLEYTLQKSIIRPLKTQGGINIKGHKASKVLIFFNSVNGITKLIEKAKLKSEDLYIICGNSIENHVKLGLDANNTPYEYYPDGGAALRKFTFITSTGFQGIDLYDEEAISIIVSQPISIEANYTMINIESDLKQASSRIRNRNNPNCDTCILLYKKTSEESEQLTKYIEQENEKKERLKNNCLVLNKLNSEQNKEAYQYTRNTFAESPLFARLSILDATTNRWSAHLTPINTNIHRATSLIAQYGSSSNLTQLLTAQGCKVVPFKDHSQKPKPRVMAKEANQLRAEGKDYTNIELYSFDSQMIGQEWLKRIVHYIEFTGKDCVLNEEKINEFYQLSIPKEHLQDIQRAVLEMFPASAEKYKSDDIIAFITALVDSTPQLSYLKNQINYDTLSRILLNMHIDAQSHNPVIAYRYHYTHIRGITNAAA